MEINESSASSKAIFEHLCEQMKKLSSKSISVEEAKAQANLAKQANNILKYELDRAIALQKFENIVIRNIED